MSPHNFKLVWDDPNNGATSPGISPKGGIENNLNFGQDTSQWILKIDASTLDDDFMKQKVVRIYFVSPGAYKHDIFGFKSRTSRFLAY